MNGYHYKECGLDSVWLADGYQMFDTDDGRAVSISDVDGLQKAIGAWVVARSRLLTGAEMRFLRTDLQMSIEDMAALCFLMPEALSALEGNNAAALKCPVDRIIRLVWLDNAGDERGVIATLNDFNSRTRAPDRAGIFHLGSLGWQIASVN